MRIIFVAVLLLTSMISVSSEGYIKHDSPKTASWEKWEVMDKETTYTMFMWFDDGLIIYDSVFSESGAIGIIFMWDNNKGCYSWKNESLGEIDICLVLQTRAIMKGPRGLKQLKKAVDVDGKN